MAQTITLKDRMVGERRAITVETKLAVGGTDKNPTSATVLVYDTALSVDGTADSGTTTTLVDAALTQADDWWNGIPLQVTDATDDHVEETEVLDFDAATNKLTFNALTFAVAADDTYTIMGTPVLREIATGTADSGSATTLVDDALTQADDYWNGQYVEITDVTDGHMERAEVTDFDATLDKLTFATLGFTVAAGDTYKLFGPDTTATVSGNEISRVGTPSDVFARPRRLLVAVRATFGADDIQECVGVLDVVPSRTAT